MSNRNRIDQLLSGQRCVLLNNPLFQKSQQHVPATIQDRAKQDRANFEDEQRDAPHRWPHYHRINNWNCRLMRSRPIRARKMVPARIGDKSRPRDNAFRGPASQASLTAVFAKRQMAIAITSEDGWFDSHLSISILQFVQTSDAYSDVGAEFRIEADALHKICSALQNHKRLHLPLNANSFVFKVCKGRPALAIRMHKREDGDRTLP